jgi:hypothetical protein
MEQFRDHVKEVENIVKAVGDGATASKINSHQCKRLASAYDEVSVVFKELVMLDNAIHVLVLPLLDEFIRVLERGKVLVLQYASPQWYELAVTRGNNQEAFNEIHLSLDTNIKALQKQISQSLKDVQFPVWTHDTTSQAAIFGRDAEEDFNEMLETLQDLGKNLPMAIAKLKGTPSGDELPLNMRIKSRKITLGKQIGEGAYGLVHEAYWLGCKIAVKIIETSEISVLQQEVNNLAGLRHPNIVQLLGFSVVKANEEENNKGKGEDQGKNKGRKSMILMELMDEDLHNLIEDQCRSTPEVPPFRQGVAIDIISQIAAGMAYLHDKGIFHGDLKASNVLVNHRGGHIDAKITDFGVSQKIQLDNRGDASSSDGLSDSYVLPSAYHIKSFIRNLHSDTNRGESSVTIQRSLSDTNLRSTDAKAIMPRNWSATSLHHYGKSDGAWSMYSGTSFSKMVGTTGWMAPEVYDTQVSIKTKHTIGLFLEVDLGAELSLRFENKVSS